MDQIELLKSDLWFKLIVQRLRRPHEPATRPHTHCGVNKLAVNACLRLITRAYDVTWIPGHDCHGKALQQCGCVFLSVCVSVSLGAILNTFQFTSERPRTYCNWKTELRLYCVQHTDVRVAAVYTGCDVAGIWVNAGTDVEQLQLFTAARQCAVQPEMMCRIASREVLVLSQRGNPTPGSTPRPATRAAGHLSSLSQYKLWPFVTTFPFSSVCFFCSLPSTRLDGRCVLSPWQSVALVSADKSNRSRPI